VPETLAYGDHPDQWIRVHRPDGASRGTVAVLHGGFWKAAYAADLAEPLSADLAARGWTAVTVEYRRVGAGGGFPETLDDVHAALGAVPEPAGAPLVTVGHSAGGQPRRVGARHHRAGARRGVLRGEGPARGR